MIFFLLEPIFLHFHYFTFIPFEISQQKFINRIFIFYQKKIYFCQFFNLIIRISVSPKLSLSGRRDLSSVYKVSFVKFKKWSSYKLSERNFFLRQLTNLQKSMFQETLPYMDSYSMKEVTFSFF